MALRRSLRHQAEQILDEQSGRYADVIIQFKSNDDQKLEHLIEAAIETERNRAMITDPAQLLPPDASAFDGTRSARRKLHASDASLVANLALKVLNNVMPFSDSLAGVASFIDSTVVKEAVAETQKLLKGKAEEALPRSLPNIGGARLMVNRGKLKQVLEEYEDKIGGVFRNAHIKAPRVNIVSERDSGGLIDYHGSAWGIEQTKALSAWSAFSTRGARKLDGERVRVAVLDTGLDATHPDLSAKVVDFAEFDRTGAIVATGVANARDSGKHGTHVAGTIAGGDASGSWIGMAPDAELIGGLVLDGAHGGSLSQIISGIDWAIENGADIINLSLGGLTFESAVGTPYQRAILSALQRGTLVVAAIGNDGHQTSGAPGNDYFSLAVGAHDQTGRCAGFSAGRTHVLSESEFVKSKYLPLVYTKPDISAPGVAVKSAIPGGKWAHMNGTSMATPHVSGAAALLYAATSLQSIDARRRAFIARDLLLGGASDIGEAGQDQRFGYGKLDAMRTIDEARRRNY